MKANYTKSLVWAFGIYIYFFTVDEGILVETREAI